MSSVKLNSTAGLRMAQDVLKRSNGQHAFQIVKQVLFPSYGTSTWAHMTSCDAQSLSVANPRPAAVRPVWHLLVIPRSARSPANLGTNRTRYIGDRQFA